MTCSECQICGPSVIRWVANQEKAFLIREICLASSVLTFGQQVKAIFALFGIPSVTTSFCSMF